MSCEKCNKACSIPLCADNISIGKIDLLSTAVTVVFTELITGRKQATEVTSDAEGNLVADVSGIKYFFSPSFIYSIAVFSSLQNACPDVDITIGDVIVECIEVEFFVCTDATGDTSVIALEDTTDFLQDENGDPLLDEHFNPLEA